MTCIYDVNGECGLLMTKQCEGCTWRMTEGKRTANQQKTYARIRGMNAIRQDYISKKYYGGTMPWNA